MVILPVYGPFGGVGVGRHQGAGDVDPLALAAGELPGPAVGVGGHPDSVEHVERRQPVDARAAAEVAHHLKLLAPGQASRVDAVEHH